MLDTTKFTEMTDDQHTEYRKQWVYAYAHGLSEECDVPLVEAFIAADCRYEDYVGQEGYTSRDVLIDAARGFTK